MNRRDAVRLMLGGAALAGAPTLAGTHAFAQKAPAFTLPPLGYAFDALEPNIDATTMRIHHDAHHAAYVNNLNGLAEKWPDLATKPIEGVLSDLTVVPADLRTGVRNNLGGHWNHTFFWQLMAPGGTKEPTEEAKSAIAAAFGDIAGMKAAVKKEALGRFGSGWSWLVVNKDGKLDVFSTPNQDSPHAVAGSKPLLGVDVWEHAYYLKYQSKRADYVDAWWNTVNWDQVAANLKKARA